jgi:hypothetical protein
MEAEGIAGDEDDDIVMQRRKKVYCRCFVHQKREPRVPACRRLLRRSRALALLFFNILILLYYAKKKFNSRSCVFVGSRCSVVVLKKKLEAAVKAALPHYVHVMLECLDGDQS